MRELKEGLVRIYGDRLEFGQHGQVICANHRACLSRPGAEGQEKMNVLSKILDDK